jgi:hypothetical protein
LWNFFSLLFSPLSSSKYSSYREALEEESQISKEYGGKGFIIFCEYIQMNWAAERNGRSIQCLFCKHLTILNGERITLLLQFDFNKI